MDPSIWLSTYFIMILVVLGWFIKLWVTFETDPVKATLNAAKTTLFTLALLIKSPQVEGKIAGTILGMQVDGTYTSSSQNELYYWTVAVVTCLIVVLFCIAHLLKPR